MVRQAGTMRARFMSCPLSLTVTGKRPSCIGSMLVLAGTIPAAVVMDAKGNLYGGTGYGGGQCNCGVIYELSPQANGTWKYTVLYTFSGYDGTGGGPMIFDDKGNLFGTGGGGAYGLGVVFRFTP